MNLWTLHTIFNVFGAFELLHIETPPWSITCTFMYDPMIHSRIVGVFLRHSTWGVSYFVCFVSNLFNYLYLYSDIRFPSLILLSFRVMKLPKVFFWSFSQFLRVGYGQWTIVLWQACWYFLSFKPYNMISNHSSSSYQSRSPSFHASQ